ncbi:hypothetical protein ETAA8_60160 [Anatilimnocola aggregata]|uniref:RapA2 cadherin-like domain-containing protein n=1 Tax=Anatilimnocola aggregata TaxID=2528021 RepID=A0A517YKV3_9BACT|nr:Ig-like domain-containing protein [Anatilimnocola aggregata]QDU30867.1 hypothetical protein ETAA8_60160 [Anatilimnocola aggregata]
MASSFSTRKRQARQNQKRRQTFLGIETLEERTVLASNVIAAAAGGYLTLVGNADDNRIEIQRSGESDVVVTSLDGVTKINGREGPVTFRKVTHGIIAVTGSGDDEIHITGNDTTVFRLLGSTTINTGNGDDIVRFTNVSMAGSLVVATGNGEDQFIAERDPDLNLVVNGLRVAGATVINTGNQDDIVSIQGSYFNKNFVLHTGLQNDSTDIRSSEFRSFAYLYGGYQSGDELNLFGNSFRFTPFAFGFATRTTSGGPTAVADTATVDEGASIDIEVLGNDTIVNGTIDAEAVEIIAGPDHGTATVNLDGTITYEHNGDEFDTDTFTYTVRDSLGFISNVATVTVTVTPINDVPVGTDDEFTVAEGSTTTLNLAANDSDAEDELDLDSITILSQPTLGAIAINSDGTVSYTHDGSETTDDFFTYTIADLAGEVSLPITVNLTITPVNDAPTIAPLAPAVTDEDIATDPIDVAIDDAETPANLLTISATSDNQTLVPNGNIAFGGSEGARTLVITPAENQSGSANITVSVSDGTTTTTQTFLVTVNPLNDAPTVAVAANVTTAEDTPTAAIAVTVGDVETAAADLTISATSSDITLVPNINIVPGGSGTDRTLVITPAPNQSGTSTITVSVNDGTTTTSQTFLLTVTAVNDAPSITTIDDITAALGTPLAPIDVTIEDLETVEASLTIAVESDNQALITNANLVFTGTGTDRVLTITPEAGVTGVATVTVTANDGSVTTTETFTVSIQAAPTISAIVDQPIDEDGATAAIPFVIGDAVTDANALVITATSSDLTLIPEVGIVIAGTGTDRTVTVTPASNQFGQAMIRLTVTNEFGLSSFVEFEVDVASVNDAPLVASPTLSVDEGAAALFDLGALASDIDGTVDVTSITIVQGQGPVNGTVDVHPDGTITYTHNGSETTTDSFKYTILDNLGQASAEGTVTVNVFPANDAPDAVNDLEAINSDSLPVTFNALDNDTDAETPAGLTVTSVANGATQQQVGFQYLGSYGFVTLGTDGVLSYSIDPAAVDLLLPGETADELITYGITDGELTDTAVFTIRITKVAVAAP